MQIDWFTFIAQAVNFLILIALLHHFLYKPVIKAMDERDKRIADELEEARLKTVEAEQKDRELEQRLQTLESQKKRMLEEARSEVAQKKTEMMEDLRSEVAEVRKRWLEAIETEQKSFTEKLGKETGQRVIGLLDTILQDLSERSLQLQTVRLFLEKISGIPDADREQLRRDISSNGNRICVVSTFEPGDQQQDQIVEAVRSQFGEKVICEFKLEKELGFGIELQTEGWRIGWNLKRYLEELSMQMDQYFREQGPVQPTSKLS